MNDEDDAKFYAYIRRLDGRLEPADPIRRCGKLVPRHEPESRKEDTQPRPLRSVLKVYRHVMSGLNRRQRRTFLLLLFGWTPEDVARSFGVSRPAIYARIRGRGGRGGMIARNAFVSDWWDARGKTNQYE